MPSTEEAASHRSSGSLLTVDLAALAANWRDLAARARPGGCAGVVKADAYGLGLARVAPALWAAGCRTFFVAHAVEGEALRAALPEAAVYVLNGAVPGAEPLFAELGLRPALNDLGALERWAGFCRARGEALPAALHIDTGMSRLGLPPDEVDRLAAEPERLDGIGLSLVMSHLACAEEEDNPMNEAQRREFERARDRLPAAPSSFANSSGLFLGSAYRFDLARPGLATYGANPTPGRPNPMRTVVRLQAPVLQVRTIDRPRTVGYGAAHRVAGPTRIATVAVGYADGYLRSASGRGRCRIGGIEVGVVGRVSMDLITLDVTGVPPHMSGPGAAVDVLDEVHDVDALAEEAGTIPYEILTGLGRRYTRRYIGAGG